MSATLAEVASHGVSLLLVTHHGGDLPECTTHLAFLSHGRLKSRRDARK
jgi:ABC-type molybdenum transport system ATPase subunit/photorepair protein PhrA